MEVGPGPVEMVSELLGQKEKGVRRRLAELDKWQMVEFGGVGAEEHTVVRQYIHGRMGKEKVKEVRRGIAAWWAERKVPDRPAKIEEVEPLLKAVEHLLAAGDPAPARGIFHSRWSKQSHYILNEWLDRFGYLDGSIGITSAFIRVYEGVIENEGRRGDLAFTIYDLRMGEIAALRGDRRQSARQTHQTDGGQAADKDGPPPTAPSGVLRSGGVTEGAPGSG